MANETPHYLTVVEPEYEGLEQYNEVQEEGVSSSWLGRIVAVITVTVAVGLIVVYFYTIGLHHAQESTVADGMQYLEQSRQAQKVQDKLHQYGVVDAANGVYQIPVDQAAKLLVKEAKAAPKPQPAPAPAVTE